MECFLLSFSYNISEVISNSPPTRGTAVPSTSRVTVSDVSIVPENLSLTLPDR